MRIELTPEQRAALARATYIEIDIDPRLAKLVRVQVESVPKTDPVRLETGLSIVVPQVTVRPLSEL